MTNFSIHLIAFCTFTGGIDRTFFDKLADSVATGIFTFVGILAGAYLAYRFALKQKRGEIFIALEKVKYEKRLEAIENCWKLLLYTTDTENSKAIFTWEKAPDGNKRYYFNMPNGREFTDRLTEYFYGSGLGVYLPVKIKELLYTYRSVIFGVLLKEKANSNNLIEIQNTKMAKDMVSLHQQLVVLLKQSTDAIEKSGSKNGAKSL